MQRTAQAGAPHFCRLPLLLAIWGLFPRLHAQQAPDREVGLSSGSDTRPRCCVLFDVDLPVDEKEHFFSG